MLSVLALAACYTNVPVTQPLIVREPLRVGFDTATRVRALADGDSVDLVHVTLLIGRAQRFANDTLFLVVSEIVGEAAYPIGAPRVYSAAGATAIVPMTAQPRMYIRESEMKNKVIPFAAVIGVLALAAGIVALLLDGHGS